MMNPKHWIWITILLVSITLAAAQYSNTQKYIIDVGESLLVNGKNISVSGLGTGFVNLLIDGIFGEAYENKVSTINGIQVLLVGYSQSPPPGTTILNITMNYTCGDGLCSQFEDAQVCCMDCNCTTSEQACISNICQVNLTVVGYCTSDGQCDDNKACTTNECVSQTCRNRPIEQCISGDSCCPKNCFAEEDTDCTGIDKCQLNEDCNDRDPCTDDTCAGTPKICSFTNKGGCKYNETICATINTANEGQYCTDEGWRDQKSPGVNCLGDYECSSNKCEDGVCSGSVISNKLLYTFYTVTIIVILSFLYYSFLGFRKKPPKPVEAVQQPLINPKPLSERPVVEVKTQPTVQQPRQDQQPNP